MKLVSTRPPYAAVSLRQAVLEEPSPEGGLFQPVDLPVVSRDDLLDLQGRSFHDVAETLALRILGDTLGEDIVREIVSGAFDFRVPLVLLEEGLWVLELFHGPTGSFKDFGARFLARLLAHLRRPDEGPIVILVATSGDTGGAVAHAVRGLEGVQAVVLFPGNRLSPVQLRQIQEPAAENNGSVEGVIPVEVAGSFDDCQKMVKDVLANPGSGIRATLTSANSVNVGRLIPQSFYYVYGWSALPPEARDRLVVSVPSGNLGNLTAGILAARMGVPFEHFVAASNDNAAMTRFLESGALPEGPSLETVSNAMDVARPSNLERLLAIFGENTDALRGSITATHHSDEEVIAAMAKVKQERDYFLDPHSAVGYLGLQQVRQTRGGSGLLLSTADPAKFPDTVIRATGRAPPERTDWIRSDPSGDDETGALRGEEATVQMEPRTEALRELLERR